jgi:DnaJ-class molecular chaperone
MNQPKIMCPTCRGSGGWGCGKDATKCDSCDGKGTVPLHVAHPWVVAAAKEGK